MKLEFFRLETSDGITVATFERPPVNALSVAAYQEFMALCEILDSDDNTRVVVLAGSPKSKAWIGGADLHDFMKLDYETRLERYKVVTASFKRISTLSRPIIAAINSHVIGAGMAVASLCDMRVAWDQAFFAKPEIDRGVVPGSAQFNRVMFPLAKTREMIFTGRRFTADELRDTGFFNYVVAKDQVMPKAMEIAEIIAKKSLPAVKATKEISVACESLGWEEGYKLGQERSARLTAGSDSKEGIRAFLEKREPAYTDNR